MKEKFYETNDNGNGFRFRIDDNDNVNIIEIVDEIELGYIEIDLSRDIMYFILNNFVKTDFI